MKDRYPETCEKCKGWVYHRAEPCKCRPHAKADSLDLLERTVAFIREEVRAVPCECQELDKGAPECRRCLLVGRLTPPGCGPIPPE